MACVGRPAGKKRRDPQPVKHPAPIFSGEGNYRFENIAYGQTASGYRLPENFDPPVTVGDYTVKYIEMEPEEATVHSLRGKVTDLRSGEALADAEIILSAGENAFTAYTDVRGDYCFPSLEEGEYGMDCIFYGYELPPDFSAAVTVSGNTSKDVEMI